MYRSILANFTQLQFLLCLTLSALCPASLMPMFFRTVYVRDACGGLDDVATANCEKVMKCQGVAFASTHEVKAMLTAQDRKPEMALLSAINFSQAMKKLHVKTSKLLAAKDVQTKTENANEKVQQLI